MAAPIKNVGGRKATRWASRGPLQESRLLPARVSGASELLLLDRSMHPKQPQRERWHVQQDRMYAADGQHQHSWSSPWMPPPPPQLMLPHASLPRMPPPSRTPPPPSQWNPPPPQWLLQQPSQWMRPPPTLEQEQRWPQLPPHVACPQSHEEDLRRSMQQLSMGVEQPDVEADVAATESRGRPGQSRRAYKKQRPDAQCRRCGMTQEEHAPLRGALQKHHLVAIRDGGHQTDPSNLFTLCHYCHKEWHTFWEEPSGDWPSYFDAPPRCQLVKLRTVPTRPRPLAPRAHSCWRCGVAVARCIELRPQRKALGPLSVDKGARVDKGASSSDESRRVCYWCQRDWDIFWKDLWPDVTAFACAQTLGPE